ncbi:hypothetical protein D1114_16680 [Cereibacter sphaeroides]|uniref:Uncharacterized protein n=1 Tax=Cereibacter sphaeroides TaxID=1063 RepID=A0AAX1UHY1_CERSP|nr:hypothetical protein [Cereibacter sphaeroides]RHZ92837.1 hypothetical protein D1114_16680 [Cereibacter sphaeroides]
MSEIIPQTIEGLSPAEAAAEIRRLRAELERWNEEKRTLIETANKTARIVAYGSAADALRMASGAIAKLGDPDANGREGGRAVIEIDTSASAVERLAETLLFRGHHDQEKITHLLRRLYAERITAAKTLRALAAERDRLRAELNAAVRERDGLRHCGRQVIAERDRLREELNAAVRERDGLRHCGRQVIAERDRLREELNAAVRERDGLRHCGRQVIAERDRLREELKEARAARQAADHDLVDRYRNTKTGRWTFPDDVAAIVVALDEARAETGALIERAGSAVRRLDTGWYDGVSGDFHRHSPDQMRMYAVQAIRALTPADATAALAEVRRAAKAEGMREVLLRVTAKIEDLAGRRDTPPATDTTINRGRWEGEQAAYGHVLAILAHAAEIEKGATS